MVASPSGDNNPVAKENQFDTNTVIHMRVFVANKSGRENPSRERRAALHLHQQSDSAQRTLE